MNKGKITILVGISGSGKSTWAHEEWKKDPLNTLIVSRDAIREAMFGFSDKTIKKYLENEQIYSLEKEVSKMENTMISEGLEAGKHVIMDDNNLEFGAIERFTYWNVPTIIKEFEVPLVEAILKDRSRVKQWGDEAIKKQYEKFKRLMIDPRLKRVPFIPTFIKNDKNKPFAILFDMDETLSHMNDRNPYDYKKVLEDSIDLPTVIIAEYLASGVAVFITTARDAIAEYDTKRWLANNGIRYDNLLMRQQGDNRPDWVVKEEMWRELAEDYYILGMFEDSLTITRRARALDLKVYNVAHNHY